MQLTIFRTYFPGGTNGILHVNGVFQCYTIELPWRNNAKRYSCIPEGKYVLLKRWTAGKGYHLLVKEVPQRSLVLIHPANDAAKELQGCIAPVTTLVGPGRGLQSKAAARQLMDKVFPAMQQQPVYLIIQKLTT